jgi:uncharacterized protein (TIGR02996 family)
MDATGEGLLRAALEVPGCDDRRLVYADWLEESGDPEYAEFIRADVRLEAMGTEPREGPGGYSERRRLEIRRLSSTRKRLRPKVRDRVLAASPELRVPGNREVGMFVLRRGLVETIFTTRAAFMEHAHSLFARHPITAVTLTDARPRLDPDLGGYVWGLYFHDDHAGEPAHRLPSDLMDWMPLPHVIYPDPVYHHRHLSDACVSYGRSLHHLPALT